MTTDLAPARLAPDSAGGPRLAVALVSLGCPKNTVDSETMLGLLAERGVSLTGDLDAAECAIVNTCSFIEAARQESIDTILQVAEHKRTGRLRHLVVAGCLAQRYGDELFEALPEVDAVVGTGALGEVVSVVAELVAGERRRLAVGAPGAPVRDFAARVVSTPPHYAYLKIAEGCDHQCAFCIIPQLRGQHRSRPLGDLVGEAERLVAGGVRELHLVSQDTTAYGSDLPGGRRQLIELLTALDAVDSLAWIRLLYTHPALWNPALMECVAQLEHVVPYADVPIQHVSDAMMHHMRRGISGARVRRVLQELRERIPGVALRTTVIVGHPGETDADFDALSLFLEEFRFERLGIFRYSREEGTPAGTAPGLDPEVIEARYERLTTLAETLARQNQKRRLGTTIAAMVDGPADEHGVVPARSYWDAPSVDGAVWLRGIEAPPGTVVEVEVDGASAHDVTARPQSVDPLRIDALGSGGGARRNGSLS